MANNAAESFFKPSQPPCSANEDEALASPPGPPGRRGLGVDYVVLRRNRDRELELVGCPTLRRVDRRRRKATWSERLDDFGWSILHHFAPEKALLVRHRDCRDLLPPMNWSGATIRRPEVLAAFSGRIKPEGAWAAEELDSSLEAAQADLARADDASPFSQRRVFREVWPLHPLLRPARWLLEGTRMVKRLKDVPWLEILFAGEGAAWLLWLIIAGLGSLASTVMYRWPAASIAALAGIGLAMLAFLSLPRLAASRVLASKGYDGLLSDEVLAAAHYSWSLAIASRRWWAPMAPLRAVPRLADLRDTPIFRSRDPYATIRRAMIARWRQRVGRRRPAKR